MGFIEVGPNGEIALPQEVCERLGLKPGDRVRIDVADNGTAIVAPRRRKACDLFGFLPKPDRTLSLQEMEDTVARAAAERATPS